MKCFVAGISLGLATLVVVNTAVLTFLPDPQPEPIRHCTPLGDVNCDGSVDFGDINLFVLAVTDLDAYEQQCPADCAWRQNWDCDQDGQSGLGDINPFVSFVLGQQCPPNRVPWIQDMTFYTVEDTPVQIELVGYDADGGRGCP
jgi:hypothetical protein